MTSQPCHNTPRDLLPDLIFPGLHRPSHATYEGRLGAVSLDLAVPLSPPPDHRLQAILYQ